MKRLNATVEAQGFEILKDLIKIFFPQDSAASTATALVPAAALTFVSGPASVSNAGFLQQEMVTMCQHIVSNVAAASTGVVPFMNFYISGTHVAGNQTVQHIAGNQTNTANQQNHSNSKARSPSSPKGHALQCQLEEMNNELTIVILDSIKDGNKDLKLDMEKAVKTTIKKQIGALTLKTTASLREAVAKAAAMTPLPTARSTFSTKKVITLHLTVAQCSKWWPSARTSSAI